MTGKQDSTDNDRRVIGDSATAKHLDQKIQDLLHARTGTVGHYDRHLDKIAGKPTQAGSSPTQQPQQQQPKAEDKK
jgi:hypothetical protein